MSDDRPSTPSDLALIDQMLSSPAPSSPPLSAADRRRLAAAAAEKRKTATKAPDEPSRAPPSPPTTTPSPASEKPSAYREGLNSRRRTQLRRAVLREESAEKERIEERAQGFRCPACGVWVKKEHVCEGFDSGDEGGKEPRSPIQRLGRRMGGILKGVRRRVEEKRKEVRFRGVVDPETDDGDGEGEGEHLMSGALGGEDLSERERKRAGKKARKSRFREEFEQAPEQDGEATLVEDQQTGHEGAERQSDDCVEASTKKTGEKEHKKKSKETIRLTRTHKRTTTGDGCVVESESETEYYESIGPASGCVVM